MGDVIDSFKPRPLEPCPYSFHEVMDSVNNLSCPCCSEEEYEDFLIGEYGAEKVLRVKEEKEREKRLSEISMDTTIGFLFSGLIFFMLHPESENTIISEMEKDTNGS